jgi:hypothetical protein
VTKPLRLSPHFTLDEFLVSATAARKGLKIGTPAPEVIQNLETLCNTVLEPLRREVRKPIVIISGYRPEWLNKLVGGSPTSDHMFGRAADFTIPGLSTFQVCSRILEYGLPFKQMIHEFPPEGWVHISYVRGQLVQKMELLTAVKQNRRTLYLKGLYNA